MPLSPPHIRFFLLAALVLFTLLPGRDAQAGDLELDWFTLETDHFIIHYHEGLGALPERVALLCEQAHTLLAPSLNWTPKTRTHVILDDTADISNGLAIIVPRNTIRLLLYGPEQRSNLGDYDDWLRLLVLHEYVHILHIDTISGPPDWINTILGKTLSPNQFVPRWYSEGLATYFESSRTSGGRVRSSLFRMYLRTASLEDSFFSIDQLSGPTTQFPKGNNVYLYGSHFVDYIAKTRGEEAFTRFHKRYGRKLAPYALNTIFREVNGEDFESLYNEWTAFKHAESLAVDLSLRIQGTTPLEFITHDGFLARSTRLHPKTQHVTYFAARGNNIASLYTHDPSAKDLLPQPLRYVDNGAEVHSWDPSGRFLAYFGSRLYKETYSYNDLFLLDTKTLAETRLTRGGRSRDPAFTPDGTALVFVRNKEGRNTLEKIDLRTQKETTLFRPDALHGQVDTPVISPDGQWAVFSFWRFGHGRDLYAIHLQHHTLLQLTKDRALDLEPSFSPDGSLLLFSSDRTGIYDIYAMELSALQASTANPSKTTTRTPKDAILRTELPTHRVTRVVSGAFNPLVVPAEPHPWLYLVSYNKNGFNLARTPFRREAFLPAPKDQTHRPSIQHPPLETPVITQAETPYQPLRYLAPLNVFPLFALTNGGQSSYGFETIGSDPVGLHVWSATASYFPDNDATFAIANYQYTRLPAFLGLGLQYSRYTQFQGLFAENRAFPFLEHSFDSQLSLSLPIAGSQGVNHNLTLAYNFRYTAFAEDPDITYTPGDIEPLFPSQGNFSSLFLVWNSSNTEGHGDSFSPEEGWDFSVNLRVRDDFTGADYRSLEMRYSAGAYLPISALLPFDLFDHNVLAVRTAGGLGRSNFLARELFFVGGIPPQELATAILNDLPLGGQFLRGFAPFTFRGEQFNVTSASYRFPIHRIESGLGTLPIFFNQLSGSAFVDYGSAFNGPIADAEFFTGFGGELKLSASLGYGLPANFVFGYAYGLGGLGLSEFYLLFGNTF